MPTDKEILEKTRKEFDIPAREWEHECFEGFYVPEICQFAMDEARKAERNRNRELESENTELRLLYDKLLEEKMELDIKNARLREALEEIAGFGCDPEYCNSTEKKMDMRCEVCVAKKALGDKP